MRSKSAFFQQTRAVVAWVLACAVALLGCYGFAPSTPRGKQCPTAAVQEVTDVKYVKTCCGKLVAVKFKRAPREGEAGYKQCQCAEKKASEKDDQTKSAEHRVAPPMHIARAMNDSLGFLIVPADTARETTADSAPEAVVFSPPTPPPQLI